MDGKNKKQKLAQSQVFSKGHIISVGITGNIGYVSVQDRNLYPDNDSRSERDREFMVPLMTREDLKDLRNAIDDVLKKSK